MAAGVFDVWCQRSFDDAGGFDSLILANTYRALLSLAGANPKLNVEEMDASRFPVRALQATGVGFVITDEARSDLKRIASDGDTILYGVPEPEPRAAFSSEGQVSYSPPFERQD